MYWGICGIAVTIAIAGFQMNMPATNPQIGTSIFIIFSGIAIWSLYMAIRESRRNHQATVADPLPVPDLQASTSDAIKKMMNGPEERVFISMLQNGELSAWAMTKGYPNLRPVDPKRWINDTLAYIEDGESLETTIQNPNQRFAWVNGGKAVVNNNAYDIHFNREQLKKHWPSLF